MNRWLLVYVGYEPGAGLRLRWYNWQRVNGLVMDLSLAVRGLTKAFESLRSSIERYEEAVGVKPLEDDLDWWEGW